MEHNICGLHQHRTWVIVVVVLLQIGNSQQRIGESCTIRRTQESGKCKLLSDCPQGLEALRSKGISPQTCGFDDARPVICCVEEAPSGKSKQKCKEYSEQAKMIASPFSPNLSSKECDELYSQFATTGNKAGLAEFPHMAVIGYDSKIKGEKEWLCAGALISDRFVVIAAACVNNYTFGPPKYIKIGDTSLDTDSSFSIVEEFNVKEIFQHSNYTSTHSGIGLLEMDKPANFTEYVRPACLDTNEDVLANKAIATGWGREAFSSVISPDMLKETLDIFTPEKCANGYEKVHSYKQTNEVLDEAQFCAKSQGTQQTCMMGPGILQVYNNDVHCIYTIVGTTSFGRDCGFLNVPDAFTRVSDYTEWIEGIVWP